MGSSKIIDTSIVPLHCGVRLWERAIGINLPIVYKDVLDSHRKFLDFYCNGEGGEFKGTERQSLSTEVAALAEIHNQIALYREHVYLAHEQKEEQENNKNE